MRNAFAAVLAVLILSSPAPATAAGAAGAARVQGQFTREGKTWPLAHGIAWQSARPDALVLAFADVPLALMDVRHETRLKELAAEGALHGLRFELDPARIDLRWVSGRYMVADWPSYRPAPPANWTRLELAQGRIAGTLDLAGVTLDFDLPIVGAVTPKVLTGAQAQDSPQANALLAYETALRRGNWKDAVRFLTPLSAATLTREVSTKEGLGQFKSAGRYMKDFLPAGEERRKTIRQVVTSGDDAAVIGDGFAADFVLIGGKWLKI